MSCGQIAGNGLHYKKNYDLLVGNTTPCSKSSHLLGSIVMVATFVIGALAVSGVLSGQALHVTAWGLGGSYFAVKSLAGNCVKRRWDYLPALIASLAIATFAAFGHFGVFTSAQMGWGLIGTAGAAGLMTTCMMVWAPKADKAKAD